MMKIYTVLAGLATLASVAVAKPEVQMTEGTKGGISKTVIETWQLSDAEKKNTSPTVKGMIGSSLNATAVAPSGKIRKNEWTYVNSTHRACFYNTYGTTVSGKYEIRLIIDGQEVNAFESVPVGAGQSFCITRYLGMWVNPNNAPQIETVARTHIEMDGQGTDNEGHGILNVR